MKEENEFSKDFKDKWWARLQDAYLGDKILRVCREVITREVWIELFFGGEAGNYNWDGI